jgi:DNA-binding transcriptional ArsR family regulator
VSWPAISQNLRVLRESGLVRERRDGTSRLYQADRAALKPLEAYLRSMWSRDIDRLRLLAEAEERNQSKS